MQWSDDYGAAAGALGSGRFPPDRDRQLLLWVTSVGTTCSRYFKLPPQA